MTMRPEYAPAPLEFGADTVDAEALAQHLRCAALLLRGDETTPQGHHVPSEERDTVLAQAAKQAQVPIWSMRIASEGVLAERDAKDRFAIKRPGKALDTPFWHELPQWLQNHCAGQHLMLDLTTLSGSALFQIHRAAVLAQCVSLSYAYTTPKFYPQVEKPEEAPPVVTRAIKQPYGYRSFAQEHLRGGQRKHVIVLGFDRHRPNKFVEHYQWPLQDVHVLLGNPAYVEGGVEQAQKSLGSVYRELDNMGHVHTINPKLLHSTQQEQGIVDMLQQLCAEVPSVDIVPLGPKPTLLGVMVYWHGLSETLQQQTRILYDFPVTRQVRTRGKSLTWVYPQVLTALAQQAIHK